MNSLSPNQPAKAKRDKLARSQPYARGSIEQLIGHSAPRADRLELRFVDQPMQHGARFNAPIQPTDRALRDVIMERLEQRGRTVAKEIIKKSGPYLTVEEVAARFGKTSQEVRDAMARKELIAVVEFNATEPSLPEWQFDENGPLQGLTTVLRALNFESPAEALLFMQSPSPQTNGESPLTLLTAHNVEAAVGLAERQGQHGAQ